MSHIRGIAGRGHPSERLAWITHEPAVVTGSLGTAGFSVTPAGRASSAGALHRDDELLVAANARIDDLAGLRKALGELAPASTAGPAAHIAAAWRRWGPDCPLHLFGDYAFALHDSRTGETYCARDHIGARPLWYALQQGSIAFADAIAPLIELPGITLDFDESYVATALLKRDFEPHHTFYRAIRKLPAGYALHLTAAGKRLTRWWKPERIAIRHGIPDAEAVAETRRLLRLAVSDRLAEHERVGVHVSGGIDSSLVAVLATEVLRTDRRPEPLAYCWQKPVGDGAADTETGWIRAMETELGITPIAPRLPVADLAALLLADWTRGPDAVNLIHEAAVQRHAESAGLTLILSGWGGDEGFSFHGRGLNSKLFLTGRWLALFREGSGRGWREGLRAIYGGARRLFVDWIIPRKSSADLIARGKSVIDPDFARRTPLLPLPRIRQLGVQATQIALLRHASPTGRLEDWAVSGAWHGIEYGYPLLDRRVLEWVLSLPPQMFRRGGRERWLAREVAEGLLPEAVRANTDKNEPLRVSQLDADLNAAWRLIAERLDDPAAPLTRARYIDMAALRRQLAEVDAPKSALGRAKRTAVQFLDFA